MLQQKMYVHIVPQVHSSCYHHDIYMPAIHSNRCMYGPLLASKCWLAHCRRQGDEHTRSEASYACMIARQAKLMQN